ncbi:hypothetical protein MANES_09G033825v8 [Manihot esculenta]|uniref:Uncharacterized protein n=1 Tax=Manihot esculenta TaxID=3983 RepID=A0ACB7H2Y9_MANES|nr:hypothetical protein MANES_09G033825v8 [Manihot esculenta]
MGSSLRLFLFTCPSTSFSSFSTVRLRVIKGDLNYCSKTDTFVGGSCGNSQCLLDFLGKYGASSMPKDCTCKPLGSNQRSCTCLIVCKD